MDVCPGVLHMARGWLKNTYDAPEMYVPDRNEMENTDALCVLLVACIETLNKRGHRAAWLRTGLNSERLDL